jgi:hypothetical protein
MGYIAAEQVKRLAQRQIKSGYGQYLLDMLSYEVRGAIRADHY